MKSLAVMASNMKKIFNSQKGFTLIESLVSVGIFSVVVSIAAGGFVQALQTQRQLEGLISANSNAGLVIEQMAREIRTGRAFCAHDTISPTKPMNSFMEEYGEDGDCFDEDPELAAAGVPGVALPKSFFNFKNASGTWVEYRYDEVERAITRREFDFDLEPVRITASNIDVDYLQFSGLGWGNPSRFHPRVTIAVGFSSKEASVEDAISHLQTTVSSRGGGNTD